MKTELDLFHLIQLRRDLLKEGKRSGVWRSDTQRKIQALIPTTTRNREILLKEYDAWLKSRLQSNPSLAIINCGNTATMEQSK